MRSLITCQVPIESPPSNKTTPYLHHKSLNFKTIQDEQIMEAACNKQAKTICI